MRIVLCLAIGLAFAGATLAANTPAQLKDIQKVADDFFKAAVDNDFDAFKDLADAKRLAEYAANEINCPLANWWESARKDVDKESAKWEFVKVKSNMPTNVELVYTKTTSAGASQVSIFLTKEGEKWLVDAAGGAF